MDNNLLEPEMRTEVIPTKKNVCGIISLVLGILSMVTLCTTGSVLGLVGIILAIVALAARKEKKKGVAIAGLVTSAISFLVGVALIAGAVYAVNAVKQTLVENGMTLEQIEIIQEMVSVEDIAVYTDLYAQYQAGELKEEDITLEKLGLEDREYTEEEKDALRALARSVGLDEDTIKKGEEELLKNH